MTRRARAGLALALMCALDAGCFRGAVAWGIDGVLASDARRLAPGDLAAPGPLRVVVTGHVVGSALDGFPVVLYRPANLRARHAPAVVFLPGLSAPEWQYESYARALASRGFVVAVRGWYQPLQSERALVHDASGIADWLITSGLADASRLGIAGHSMGARNAIRAALSDTRFRVVVALEPDDRPNDPIARGPVATLRVPLLLVGAEDAWRGWDICGSRARNYRVFFSHAPPGTIEIEIHHADHVQVMDDPGAFGYGICHVGTADSFSARTLARRATVAFLVEHLQSGPPFAIDPGRVGSIRRRPMPSTP